MNSMLAILIFEGTIILSAALQIPLKKSATNPNKRGLKFFLNPIVIAVYASFLLVTFVTTYVYQFVDLTLSTLLYKTEYVFIALFSTLCLKERLTRRKLIGFVVILAGVLLYSFAS